MAVYPANCRSPRTRANSRELERTPRELANGSPTPTVRRTPPDVRRSTPNVRRSSAEFARVRPSSRALRRELANGSPENSFAGRNLPTSNGRSPRTGSPRTTFAANVNFGERVRRELMSYVHVRHKHPNGRLTTKQCNLPSSLRASCMAFTKSIAYRLFIQLVVRSFASLT